MNEQRTGLGEGILRGLKKIIFTDAQNTESENNTTTSISGTSGEVTLSVTEPEKSVQSKVSGDKKLRVYELLGKLNKPGCDFFEVWNASVEMGGVTVSNIRSAYTSLRFADASLNKEKLIDTGNAYMNELKKILHEETAKRLAEKKRLETEKDTNTRKLEEELLQIEKQISTLQQKLSEIQQEKENIQTRFTPAVTKIDSKIEEGRQSVDIVLSEMQEVMKIIQKEIN